MDCHRAGPRRRFTGAAPFQYIEPASIDMVARVKKPAAVTMIGNGESFYAGHVTRREGQAGDKLRAGEAWILESGRKNRVGEWVETSLFGPDENQWRNGARNPIGGAERRRGSAVDRRYAAGGFFQYRIIG